MMLIFIVLLYFLAACGAIFLACFPQARSLAWRSLDSALRRVRWRPRPVHQGEHWRRRVKGWRKWLLRHRWRVTAGAVILTVPPLLAWLASDRARLPGYESSDVASNTLVAGLLKGEQLNPPVPLPPMVFTTQEVTLVRPMLADASRNWGLLQSDFSQRLLLIFKIMKEQHGYDMALLEGYRSPARQDMLAAMGSHVSNARAFQSYHQYGLAADCAFLREGRLVISEKDPWAMRGYQLYGKVAESLGMTWGGRWTMMDFGHTELRLPGALGK